MKTHFIFTGDYGWGRTDWHNRYRSYIQKSVTKYKMESLMVTFIQTTRYRLITKERMENLCKGKEERKESVNDDLESFIQDLQLGEEPNGCDSTYVYFLPKLTKEEFQLAERKDSSYLQLFLKSDPDVDEAEMKLSESKSKFAYWNCLRKTFTIENSPKLQHPNFFCL